MEGLTSKKTDMPYEHEAYLSECLGADSISTRINTVSGIVSDRNSDGSSTTCYLYSSDNSQKGNFWLAVKCVLHGGF